MEGAYKNIVIVAFLMVLAVEAKAARGQICGMSPKGFKACEPSVSGQNAVPPTAECCSALSIADLSCFCQFKGSTLLGAYGINFDQAIQLPPKCGLESPNCI